MTLNPACVFGDRLGRLNFAKLFKRCVFKHHQSEMKLQFQNSLARINKELESERERGLDRKGEKANMRRERDEWAG